MNSVLQKYPAKFVGMCLADPTEGGGGVEELQRLIEEVQDIGQLCKTTAFNQRCQLLRTQYLLCGLICYS